MLIRDVFWRCSVLLSDAKPQFRRWSENEFVAWATDGQRAIAKFLPPAAARLDVVKLRPGVIQRIDNIAASDIKPGDGSTPQDIQATALYKLYNSMGTDGLTPGAICSLVSSEARDAFMPTWMASAASDAIEEYSFDPRLPTVFMVSPPVTGIQWAQIGYQSVPSDIPEPVTPGDYLKTGGSMRAIGISDAYADDLINYMAARGALKDAENGLGPLATLYTQMFLTSINAQAKALTGTNPNLSTLPFAPARAEGA